MNDSVAHLRQLKAANEASQAAISEAVAQIAAAHEAFERQRAALAGELSRLQAEVTAHEAAAASRAAALPQLPEGESGGVARKGPLWVASFPLVQDLSSTGLAPASGHKSP